MNVTLSELSNLDNSMSQRRKTSRSKRGIQVTLSQQKNNYDQNKCNNFTDKIHIQEFSYYSEVPCYKSVQTSASKLIDESKYASSIKREIKIPSSANKSENTDMVSVYFQKNQRKQQVQNESQKLDEQIKKLQLEIYNTRTKISETKYLSRKEEQAKAMKKAQHNNREVKSPQKKLCQSKSNELLSRSPNSKAVKKINPKQQRSSSPPHPSLLSKMFFPNRKNQPDSYVNQNELLKNQLNCEARILEESQNNIVQNKMTRQKDNQKKKHNLNAKKTRNSKKRSFSACTKQFTSLSMGSFVKNKNIQQNLYLKQIPAKKSSKNIVKISDFTTECQQYLKSQKRKQNVRKQSEITKKTNNNKKLGSANENRKNECEKKVIYSSRNSSENRQKIRKNSSDCNCSCNKSMSKQKYRDQSKKMAKNVDILSHEFYIKPKYSKNKI